MKEIIKSLVPNQVLLNRRKKINTTIIEEWKAKGCPVPPPHAIKQQTISDHQNISGSQLLVETGTYMGEMVEAMKYTFNKVITIELGEDLYAKAVKRFKNDKNVSVKQGDSGEVLPAVIKEIKEDTIFWLDGHYSSGATAKGSKDCPIYKELDAIFEQNDYNHILLIDDARDFNGTNDYPTLEELQAYIHHRDPAYGFEVKHDIIRCVKQ